LSRKVFQFLLVPTSYELDFAILQKAILVYLVFEDLYRTYDLLSLGIFSVYFNEGVHFSMGFEIDLLGLLELLL
jgi:hypothetical protein